MSPSGNRNTFVSISKCFINLRKQLHMHDVRESCHWCGPVGWGQGLTFPMEVYRVGKHLNLNTNRVQLLNLRKKNEYYNSNTHF